MATDNRVPVSEEDFIELKDRCKILFEADPSQAHTDASLRRFLRAFQDVDVAFKMLLKHNKWRQEFGVENLSPDDPEILQELTTGKAIVLSMKDVAGRPVVYISVKKHNAYDRDIEKMKKFIVYILENACKKCHEDVIDNLCVVFDMANFSMQCMDYEFVKTLIWLLSRHFPERLGVCLVLNSPLVFWGCWAAIKPWLNEVTANKVVFVSDDKTLSEYLCPDILPQGL